MARLLGPARAEQRRQMAILDRIEAAFMPAIAREIARSMRWTVDQFEETGAVPVDRRHLNEIRDILTRQADMAVRLFGKRILAAQKSDALTLERKDFAETLAKLAIRYIGLEAFRRRITNITDTTRQQIINGVDRGFNEGLGQAGTARLIRDVVPALSRQRSAVIARTETHGAANYGANGAAKETGLTLRKEWISAEDERTREDHADMNGTIVDMDAAFDFPDYSLQFPGDPSGPAEGVINCRCAIGYQTTD